MPQKEHFTFMAFFQEIYKPNLIPREVSYTPTVRHPTKCIIRTPEKIKIMKNKERLSKYERQEESKEEGQLIALLIWKRSLTKKHCTNANFTVQQIYHCNVR